WALWLGRPLLGQWTWDVLRLVDYLVGEPVRPGSEGVLWAGRKDVQRERLGVYAIGAAGVVALCAAALDERIRWAACGGLPASYVADKPYSNASVPMGIAAPGILSVGDVPHLAALVAPRPLSIHGALRPDGARLDEHEISEGFAFTRRMYELLGAGEQFAASSGANG
ncbi:MAG: hypothetical protein HY000_01070, partial [Planctomycetes bacterium]|nr:hypothetical protein [Planctomycetota bacterium]